MSEPLDGVHPELVKKIGQVWAAMSLLGYAMKPTAGCRTALAQSALYAQGRFGHPGPIVTHCDGIKTLSNHQPQADGFGHAVDSCFQGADPYLEKDPRGELIWEAFGACVRAVGLKWGGVWPKDRVDRPHAEL